MRVLVTGATGLLGRVLVEDLAEEHEVIALSRSRRVDRRGVQEFRLDLRDHEALGAVWARTRPQLVIHTAALANVEACQRDPELAHQLNVDVAARVAEQCEKHGSRLVHVSTDAVFAGEAGPHREGDLVAPQTVYAETKLAGEHAVRATLERALIARVNFFGWSQDGDRSLAEFFLNALSVGDEVPGYVDVEFACLYNRDLGDVLVQASAAGVHGVRHVASRDRMSKHDFGRLVATTFGYDPELVREGRSASRPGAVRRAAVLSLSAELLSRELGRTMPSIEEGLQRMRLDRDSGYAQALRLP